MTQLDAADTTLEALLSGSSQGPLDRYFGFGGLHGGVVAALLLAAMEQRADPAHRPLEITAHFGAPTRSAPALRTSVVRAGRHSSLLRADATVADSCVATAVATFARPRAGRLGRTFTPDPPHDVAPLAEAHRVDVPVEFVPIMSVLEIRAAHPSLPYAGGSDPELCAWIRLVEHVSDPLHRLVILADALAPSYAAVLDDLVLIPTARMTLKFTPQAHAAGVDWVLVRARTTQAAADGWMSEGIDIWDTAGRHLASASQLRTVADQRDGAPAHTGSAHHQSGTNRRSETT